MPRDSDDLIEAVLLRIRLRKSLDEHIQKTIIRLPLLLTLYAQYAPGW